MLHDLLHYQMQIHQCYQDIIFQIWELPFQLSNIKNKRIIIKISIKKISLIHITCLIKSSVFHHPSRLIPGFIITHASSSSNFKRPSISVRKSLTCKLSPAPFFRSG